jgi:hypothetical protein
MRWGRGLIDIAFLTHRNFHGVSLVSSHPIYLNSPNDRAVASHYKVFKKSLKNLWWSLSMSSTFSHHLLKFCRHHHEDFYGDGWYILHSRSFLPAQLGEVIEVSFMSFEYQFLFFFPFVTPKYTHKNQYKSSTFFTFFHLFLIYSSN